MRRFLCFAEGRDGSYEAICVDLDIAVQGQTFQEVVEGLNQAVSTYIDDALKEDDEVARRLLSRRAPWHVRMGYILRTTLHMLRRSNGRSEEATFDVACPA